MMIFFVFLITGTDIVSGAMFDVTSEGYNPVDVSQFGVDINRCTTLTFKIKSCEGSNILLGNGTMAGSYEVLIGGDSNRMSGFRHCAQGCYHTDKIFPTADVLECSSFRPFWISWANDRLSLGRGNVPFTNIIFDEPDPGVHDIKVLAVAGYFPSISATLRLGDETKSVFAVESMHDAKYNTAPLSQVNTNVSNCSRSCHENANCGMFSFNKDRNECMLFDRKTPSTTLMRQIGWKTWKIQYCWA